MLLLVIASIVSFAALCHGGTVLTITPEIKKAFVDTHNEYRAKVGSPPLTWNDEIATFAATKTGIPTCTFSHTKYPPGVSYGENLYWRWPIPQNKVWAAGAAAKYWGDEEIPYGTEKLAKNWATLCFPYPAPAGHKACGHFTQEVWKDTKELGCAIADCPEKNSILILCNYSPPGNWVGQDAY